LHFLSVRGGGLHCFQPCPPPCPPLARADLRPAPAGALRVPGAEALL